METEMHTTKYTIAAVALIAALAVSGAAEAGKFNGIFHPDGSSAAGDIGDVLKNPGGDKPDFGGIFNPKPEPVINKPIDVMPDPLIYHDLGIDFGNGGAPGAADPGLTSYKEVARLNIGLRLNCAVAGTPVEFPDDLVIANAGLIDVAAGTQIQWQIAAAGQSGIAVLAKTLKPGKSVKFNGVLAGGVEIGTACAITAIGH
jgi:hypothetical protein